MDAIAALTFVGLSDRAEVRRALLTALKIRPRDRAGFDELFARFWAAENPGEIPARESAAPDRPGRVRPVARSAGGATTGAGTAPGADVPEGTIPGYSAEALLRRKPFDECTAADLAAMERLLERLASKLATRRSRRLVPSPARGAADLRRSFRRAVATGG
ncbi:MAG TPA: hypothetical protein VLB47_09805, partial [Solirubrobacteraceae bacterium]|nr:hypothetical protein [Solirubrobacteraceae bacterium]